MYISRDFECLISIYIEKAGLHYCCSANQGSSIALTSEQTTLEPTPYVYMYATTRVHQ